jgi:hypothetical protein
MNFFRRLSTLIGSFLIIFGSFVVLSPAANASPTCYGDYCSNQDPETTGCNEGAWTQDIVDVYYAREWPFHYSHFAGTLELRASNTCGTQWARFTSADDEIVSSIQVVQPDTGYKTDFFNLFTGQEGWSNQVYSPDHCVFAEISLYHPESNPFVGPTQVRTTCI